MPDQVPPSAPMLKAIEDGSKRISSLATDLSNRITLFEDWLNQLPGRVETTHLEETDPFGGYFGLRLHRVSKRWILSFGWVREGDEEEDTTWTPLSDGSIEIKLRAVALFPIFLRDIVQSQEALARRLEAAHREFDEFATAIGVTKASKEGK